MPPLTTPIPYPRACLERVLYLTWSLSFVASICMTYVGLLLLIPPSQTDTRILVGCGIITCYLSVWFRFYGNDHLHFKEHEDAMDTGFARESLTSYEHTIVEAYTTVMHLPVAERTKFRSEIKTWLAQNWRSMSKGEQATAKEYFYYLTPNS